MARSTTTPVVKSVSPMLMLLILMLWLPWSPFPPFQGSALQMLEDVNTGIAWVVRKIERYGGDPDSTYLVGQSAGGQLAMLALLNQASQAVAGEAVLGAAPVWHPLDIKGFVGVSGAYDLEGLEGHLHKRGLYKSLLGEQGLGCNIQACGSRWRASLKCGDGNVAVVM